ncbi:MAG: hypothetical protein FWB76_08035 [Oscillospiraceae bacterium]|nr:hypothetical protein [Oscillospiraceae bacterium]
MFRNETIKLRSMAHLAQENMPWHEVAWLHFSRFRPPITGVAPYTPVGEGYSFRYVLYLRNGRRYTLEFFGKEIHDAVKLALAEHAPNQHEPYSRTRYRQWKRDARKNQ